MNAFKVQVEVRWSDLDPNFHLRHSAYYDFGAYCRICFLEAHRVTSKLMQEQAFGPIIFREECVFKKEIHLGDKISLDVALVRARKDGSRWTMQHRVYKGDEIVAAIITLDGAWMDIRKRKLMVPPEIVRETFSMMPKAENFEWLPGQ